MKKLTIFTIIATLASTSAIAQFVDNGGFKGPSEKSPTTVIEAKKMKDETYVLMQGKIEKKIKNDKYTFTDKTGSMTVEIDNDVWKGTVVTPNDNTEITGEIDKDLWNSSGTEVDVKTIKIVK